MVKHTCLVLFEERSLSGVAFRALDLGRLLSRDRLVLGLITGPWHGGVGLGQNEEEAKIVIIKIFKNIMINLQSSLDQGQNILRI